VLLLGLLSHVPGDQHFAQNPREGVVVVELGELPAKAAVAAISSMNSRDQPLGTLWRRRACQLFAHEHPHRLLKQRVPLFSHVAKVGVAVLVLEHCA
jgi:hypothetical protein